MGERGDFMPAELTAEVDTAGSAESKKPGRRNLPRLLVAAGFSIGFTLAVLGCGGDKEPNNVVASTPYIGPQSTVQLSQTPDTWVSTAIPEPKPTPTLAPQPTPDFTTVTPASSDTRTPDVFPTAAATVELPGGEETPPPDATEEVILTTSPEVTQTPEVQQEQLFKFACPDDWKTKVEGSYSKGTIITIIWGRRQNEFGDVNNGNCLFTRDVGGVAEHVPDGAFVCIAKDEAEFTRLRNQVIEAIKAWLPGGSDGVAFENLNLVFVPVGEVKLDGVEITNFEEALSKYQNPTERANAVDRITWEKKRWPDGTPTVTPTVTPTTIQS